MPARYDLYERDGHDVGRFEIPPRFTSAVRRGDHVWGVEYGEDE